MDKNSEELVKKSSDPNVPAYTRLYNKKYDNRMKILEEKEKITKELKEKRDEEKKNLEKKIHIFIFNQK